MDAVASAIPTLHPQLAEAQETDQITQLAMRSVDENEIQHNIVSEKQGNESISLPPYDKALVTRNVLLTGLALTWIVDIICIILTILIFVDSSSETTLIGTKNRFYALHKFLPTGIVTSALHSNLLATQEVLSLFMAFGVTLCNECLGLIHTVSLRWALWHEKKIKFNSNLRLLNHSTFSKANGWYSNLVFGFCMAIAYAATAQLFIPLIKLRVRYNYLTGTSMVQEQSSVMAVSGLALGLLSFGLGGQLILSSWSFFAMRKHVPTWSANCLNNSLACLHHGWLQRESNRCMISYSENGNRLQQDALSSVKPRENQPSLFQSRATAGRIGACLWICAVITIIFAFVIWTYGRDSGSFIPIGGLHSGPFASFTIKIPSVAPVVVFLIIFLFILALQLHLTFTLHITELIVNALREERDWQKACICSGSTRANNFLTEAALIRGARINNNAIVSAVSSPHTILLFIFKSLIHWAYGTSFGAYLKFGHIEEGGNVIIIAYPLFLLAGFTFLLAIFITIEAKRCQPGPQPSAFGHFQTLVNLIDVWPSEKEKIFWGDKSGEQEIDSAVIRHAGTNTNRDRLGLIVMTAEYK